VIGADFTLYLDTQQAVNLAIYCAFQNDGIEFAYPTQQVYVSQLPQTRNSEGPQLSRFGLSWKSSLR
jgi:small-conductance mechanosensitive channel